MALMKIKERLKSDSAYLLYSIFILLISIALTLTPKLFDKNDFVFQVIAALIAAMVTVVITRLMLNKQTESNMQVMEKQAFSDYIRMIDTEIYKNRFQYAHTYLSLLQEIIEHKEFTSSDFVAIESCLNHILIHAINAEDNINMDPVCNIAYLTKRVIESACSGQEDYHEDLLLISNYLFQGQSGYYYDFKNNESFKQTVSNIGDLNVAITTQS